MAGFIQRRVADKPFKTSTPTPTQILGWDPSGVWLPIVAPVNRAVGVAASVWVPQHSDAEGSALDWIARYPDQVARATTRAVDHPAFTTGSTAASLPVPDLSWWSYYPAEIARAVVLVAQLPFYTSTVTPPAPAAPDLAWRSTYPDQIDARRFLSAAQLVGATGALAPALPVPDRSWAPTYPDWLARATMQTATHPFFTTGATASILPVPSLSWKAQHPDRLWSITLPSAAAPFFSLEPFPRVAAAQLTAWGIYPDRVTRATLPIALMPSFGYGTWDPLPNPPVVYQIEDRILLGQDASLETPAYPSIGGGTTWS